MVVEYTKLKMYLWDRTNALHNNYGGIKNAGVGVPLHCIWQKMQFPIGCFTIPKAKQM